MSNKAPTPSNGTPPPGALIIEIHIKANLETNEVQMNHPQDLLLALEGLAAAQRVILNAMAKSREESLKMVRPAGAAALRRLEP